MALEDEWAALVEGRLQGYLITPSLPMAEWAGQWRSVWRFC
jgi:hypothetical protein